MEEQRLRDSAQRISNSKERTKLLLERAEGLVASRLAFKTTGGDTAEEKNQRAFDLRAAIATRETLKGELEQHKARRGRLTELHNELNVAEEEMTTVKLDINEHEMALDEMLLKIADVENHMNVLINDLLSLRDQLPKLYETEGYHRGQVEALNKELNAAKELVEKKRQMVVETEANLNFLMNVGMSSVMWSETEKIKTDNDLKTSFSIKKKWSTVGKVKGEDIIYDADLTPRTADWGKKQRESKVKYMWRIVFHAMKLGYLTHKIPFPPEAFARMMNYIHGSDDAETIKDLQAQLSNTHRVVSDQTDAIKKLERLVQLKGERFKEAELKYSAVQQKYEKVRVEAAALKKLMATMEDKSVTQLQKENELYEVERRNLYGKLYGRKTESSANLLARKSSFSTEGADRLGRTESFVVKQPAVEMDIPVITESKHLGMKPLGGAVDDCASRLSPIRSSSPPSDLRRVHTLTSALGDVRTQVEERVHDFNGPAGTGFLQQQLDRYVAAQKQFDTRLNSAKHQRATLHMKLELTESLAMHAFDSFARGRQSVEEELEEMMVQSQKVQKIQLERYVEERRAFEARISKLEASLSVTERDYTSAQAFAASLEKQCESLMTSKDALEAELKTTKDALETASSSFSPEDVAPLAATIGKLNAVNCQDLIDYDTAIGRILPMKSQRSFVAVVTKLSAGMQQSFLFVCTHLRRLFENSLRRTTASVIATEEIAKKIQEQFESLISLSSSIGRIGLDAIENWDAFKRELYVDGFTDVDDLPQPPPVYLEKEPPPSADADTQTVESSLRSGKHNMSSQTAVVSSKTVAVETTITLGKGGGDGLGFVSSDKVKRMEDLLEAKIREADDAQQQTETIKTRAAHQAAKHARVHMTMNKHAMYLEDMLATVSSMKRREDDLAQSLCSVHDVDASVQVHPRELCNPRDVQTQVWFPDSAAHKPQNGTEVTDSVVLMPNEGNSDQARGVVVTGVFPLLLYPEQSAQTEATLKAVVVDAETITEWTAATFASPHHTEIDEHGDCAASPVVQRPTFNIAQLITLPPTPTGTISEAALSPKSGVMSGPSSPSMLSPHRTQSMRSVGGVASLVQLQGLALSHPIATATPHKPMPAAVVTSHVGVQTDFSVPQDEQTIDLEKFEAFCGAVSGRSMTPPEPQTIHVPVVDDELTAKTIAEFEASLESKLMSEFGQHRQQLEDELDAKARDYEQQHQQVDRDALKLRLRVANMQQSYEAIAASVTKFKYAAKQLEAANEELQKERSLRQELEKKLSEHKAASALSSLARRSSGGKLAPSSQISSEAAVPLRGGITGRNPSLAPNSAQAVQDAAAAVATSSVHRRPSRAASAAALLDAADVDLLRTLRREKDQMSIQVESLKSRVVALEEELEEQRHQTEGTMTKFLQRNNSTPGLPPSSGLGQVASSVRRESSVARTMQQLRNAKRSAPPLAPASPTRPSQDSLREIPLPPHTEGDTAPETSEQSNPLPVLKNNAGDDALIVQLQTRVNELQLQLLASHKDIMETRSAADRHQHTLKESVEALQRALAQSEVLAKKLQQDESRAKSDLQKERQAHVDSVAAMELSIAEQQRKAAKVKSDLERQIQTLQKQHEAAEKSSLAHKQQLHSTRDALDTVRTALSVATMNYASKVRATASLVSQLHCALVETAVAIKAALVLDNFQLADPMMGETAVKVMRMLVDEDCNHHNDDPSSNANVAAANDQLLDMSKYLGDRDVDLLRRMTLSVKHFAGVATIASAESSRPTTRDAAAARSAFSTPHTFGLHPHSGHAALDDLHVDAGPLPMTPRRHPPASQFLGSLIHPVRTNTSALASTPHPGEEPLLSKLPHIQMQSRSPTRRPVFDVKLAEGDHTFSLFPSSSALNGHSLLFDKDNSKKVRAGGALDLATPPQGGGTTPHPFVGGRHPPLLPRSVSTPPTLSIVNGLSSATAHPTNTVDVAKAALDDGAVVDARRLARPADGELSRVIHAVLPSRATLGSRKDRRRILLPQ